MLKIRLETEDGRFVCVGTIPPFRTLPEVVIWEQRIFQLQTVQPDTDRLPLYREAFTAVIVIPVSYEDER